MVSAYLYRNVHEDVPWCFKYVITPRRCNTCSFSVSASTASCRTVKGCRNESSERGLGFFSLASSFPRAVGPEVVFRATNAAFHDVAILIFRIRSSSVAFPGGVRTVSFAFAFQEHLDVIVRVEEATAATFLATTFALQAFLEGTSEPSHRSAGVSPPCSSAVSESSV